MKLGLQVVLSCLLLSGAPAHARVAASATEGFSVTHSATIAAKPETIWAQLIHPERWWNKEHSWSGDAANLSLTPRAGGCFCEKLADRGFAEHARVVYAAPGKMLRLSGGLGPLQSEAVVGTLTVTITPSDGAGSILEFDYVAGGHARFDLKEVAPAVDMVVGEQHRRLGELIANGRVD